MKLDFFIRIPMEQEYDLNAQFVCIIFREQERIPMEEEYNLNAQVLCIIFREQVLFQNMLYLPTFFALYELF